MRDPSTDHTFIAAFRQGDFTAWPAYMHRFQPTLEAYARRASIPEDAWDACINDVLTDEAIRLSTSSAPPPHNLLAYLVTAAQRRYFAIRRSDECRHRHYAVASDDHDGEPVVVTTCSADALRSGEGVALSTSPGVARLALTIDAQLTRDERLVLGWLAEGVTRPIIAEWLGISTDSCAKRVWRLCYRLRAEAAEQLKNYSARERRDVERVLRRAGYVM
jgi:hypothetical protein